MTRKEIKKLLNSEFEHYNKNSSVYDLMNYYYGKKIYRKLNKKQKQAIKELAIIKHKQNKKESMNWLKSGIFKLSCEKLIKNKKMRKVFIDDNNWYYNGDIVEVMDYMAQIVNNANDKNLNEELRAYCEGEQNAK